MFFFAACYIHLVTPIMLDECHFSLCSTLVNPPNSPKHIFWHSVPPQILVESLYTIDLNLNKFQIRSTRCCYIDLRPRNLSTHSWRGPASHEKKLCKVDHIIYNWVYDLSGLTLEWTDSIRKVEGSALEFGIIPWILYVYGQCSFWINCNSVFCAYCVIGKLYHTTCDMALC